MMRIIFIVSILVSQVATANIDSQLDKLYFNLLNQEELKNTNQLQSLYWTKSNCQSTNCIRHRQVLIQAIDVLPIEKRQILLLEIINNWDLSAFSIVQLGHLLVVAEDSKISSDALWKFEAHLISRIFTHKPSYEIELLFGLLQNSQFELSDRLRNTLLYLKPNLTPKVSLLAEETHNFPSEQMIKDLLIAKVNEGAYRNGAYANTPKLLMFCRSNRDYHCLMILRKPDGSLHRNADGTLWTHSALGSSRKNRPSTQSNGNTPAGIFRMDGVMPSADQQMVFGKYRRIILQFVEKSSDEENLKNLMPLSSHESDWWKTTVIARDIGRDLFRVHGTGLRSQKRTNYYPFVRTVGCVAQRENRYEGTSYTDQRILLDELMKVSGLDPIYQNESKLKGLLYVVNINNKKKNVTLDDLSSIGIE